MDFNDREEHIDHECRKECPERWHPLCSWGPSYTVWSTEVWLRLDHETVCSRILMEVQCDVSGTIWQN